jgi:hypothetical protein
LTNRYYDPARARFVTRDPIGLAGGMNQYGFVGNTPLSGIDPLGLCGDVAPDADVEAYIHQVRGGYHAVWGGVRTVGNVLNAGTEVAAGFNPVTSPGIAFNKLHEGKYGEATLFALPVVGAFGGEGGAAAELPGFFGKLSGRSAMVSESGLSIVETHLAQFGEDAGNAAMLGRLRSALSEGKLISGADLSFYFHEPNEATMRARGVEQEAAHAAAFAKYGVSHSSVYLTASCCPQ